MKERCPQFASSSGSSSWNIVKKKLLNCTFGTVHGILYMRCETVWIFWLVSFEFILLLNQQLGIVLQYI